jgi:hypothetical protein
MNRWNSESTNQSINDSMNQWMNDSVNPRIDDSMNQRVNASMNVNPHLFVWWYYQRDYQTVASKWINGSTNQWIKKSMNQVKWCKAQGNLDANASLFPIGPLTA